MKQWFYTIHGWLGLNFGLMLFIVCLSGTIAVVSHEIDWLCTPSLRVTPTETRASWGTMTNAVRAAYPDSELQYVNAPLGAWFACEFILKSPARVSKRVYVDPYTGSVKGHAPWFNAQRFFRDFHRRFFWYSWLGIWVVAAFGFVLLGAVASGAGILQAMVVEAVCAASSKGRANLLLRFPPAGWSVDVPVCPAHLSHGDLVSR